MRKLISILLLFVFLYNIGGYFLWFYVLQCKVKKELATDIQNAILDENLTLISVSSKNNKDINWIEKDKEFQYKGNMFDVVKIQIHHQRIDYYCINDIKESQLISNFIKNGNSRKDTEKKARITYQYGFYLQKFYLKTNQYSIVFKFTEISSIYKSSIPDIASPPPKYS